MMNRTGDNLPTQVAELYSSLIAAWNDADATRFAAQFTAEGSLVGFDGSTVNGRSEIGRHLCEIFDHHQTATYVCQVRFVRALGASHALLEAVAGMVQPGDSDIKPELNTVQCLTASRTGDQWRIEHYQNTPAAYYGRPEIQHALNEELRRLLPQASE